MKSVLKFQLDGIPFVVKLVRKGERYGYRGCLVHDQDEPLVEFYDARFGGKDGFAETGQFISRYHRRNLVNRGNYSLDLDMDGSLDWQLSSSEMSLVNHWLFETTFDDL